MEKKLQVSFLIAPFLESNCKLAQITTLTKMGKQITQIQAEALTLPSFIQVKLNLE